MKPKIMDFYRLAIYFPSTLNLKEIKNNRYLVKISVPIENIEAYYEFNSRGINYVGKDYNECRL
jgi:hypothetical protein